MKRFVVIENEKCSYGYSTLEEAHHAATVLHDQYGSTTYVCELVVKAVVGEQQELLYK